MAFSGLNDYIRLLESKGELKRINTFIDPALEITEVTDRISKNGGPALLFENNGYSFPVLINAFGSDKRMSLAIGRDNLEEAGKELDHLFRKLTAPPAGTISKLSGLPGLFRLSGIMPERTGKKGKCQKVIIRDPDLNMLPVLKCWPNDGGRFITLPIVHTRHPETGHTNAGMYRMQIIDKATTGMHWQLHKTGANHFEAWKNKGARMPVSVALGGDPVYTYAATAPLPENIDEYILAGFLRNRKVKLVKCITNDLYVPEDADIIIEGYVDPGEDLIWEGPFGDHTGFYSLADWYPAFHVTCITHAVNAVYPATIVGIPPQEDSFMAKATEKIFLTPIKLTLLPEIEDMHMPDAGVAHNLVIVKTRKNYQGQGMKVINSLMGAGQMMFTKYMIAVSGDCDIRNYTDVAKSVFSNTDFSRDLLFSRGPLDVLDHSSDTFAFGGKLGVDATIKTKEENSDIAKKSFTQVDDLISELERPEFNKIIVSYNVDLVRTGIPVVILAVERRLDTDSVFDVSEILKKNRAITGIKLILVVDHTVDVKDFMMVAWQVSGNSDPVRDHYLLNGSTLLLDGTIKTFRPCGFIRKWPNVVCSDEKVIKIIDEKWDLMGLGDYIASPSLKTNRLKRGEKDEITAV